MSLIHEALKKAEQQRQLGEPPTLGTPFSLRRRRQPLLPYLGVAVVVTLAAGWWMALAPNSPPAAGATDNGKPPSKSAAVTAAPDTTPAPTPAATPAPAGADKAASTATERRPSMAATAAPNTHVVASLAPPPRVHNQSPTAEPHSVKDVAERESEPHPAGANPLAPGESAGLALGAASSDAPTNDPAGLAAKMAVKEKEWAGGVPATSAPAPARPAPDMVASDAGANSGRKPTADTSKPTQPVAATAPPAVTPPPPVTAAAPTPPTATIPTTTAPPAAVEQLPMYWQLPYGTRKELPEFKLTMHVFSATPKQRFVVLNGNRQVEGDELGAEVILAEIRSDGVVLSYHGQRFLVPRGGS